MNKNKKILFVGFDRDYEKHELSCLIDKYNVMDFTLFTVIYKLVKHTKVYKLKSLKIILGYIVGFLYKPDLVVIKDNIVYVSAFESTRGKKILIARNTLKKNLIEKLIKFDGLYSFDKGDCQIYEMKRYQQYASGFEFIRENPYPLSNDIGFVGTDKGRKNYIEHVFFLCDKFNNKKLILDDALLTYNEYLKELLSCRIVLDIVKDDQSSETMRFIEAMCAKRKVITNNRNIINHDLYHPSNVLILEDLDSLDSYMLTTKVNELLTEGFYELEQGKLNTYSPKYVLSSIIDESLESH